MKAQSGKTGTGSSKRTKTMWKIGPNGMVVPSTSAKPKPAKKGR